MEYKSCAELGSEQFNKDLVLVKFDCAILDAQLNKAKATAGLT